MPRPTRWALRALAVAGLSLAHGGCVLAEAGLAVFLTQKKGSRGATAGPPPPQVQAVAPTAVSHAGGATLSITGQNFSLDPANVPAVAVGGVAATDVRVVDATRLEAKAPALAKVGAVDVVVTDKVTGAGSLSGALTYTNLPPTVSFKTIASPQGGNVAFQVVIVDPEGDPADLAVSVDSGGGFQPLAATTLFGGLTKVSTQATGVTHDLTWDSRTAFPTQNAASVRLRVTPTDTLDGQSGSAGDSQVFALVNNGPVKVEVVQPGTDAFDVSLAFKVTDVDPGETVTLTAVTWTDTQTGASGSATRATNSKVSLGQTLANNGTFAFLWDSYADLGIGQNQLVTLSLTVRDSAGNTSTSATNPFFVNNGPFGDARIHPVTGTSSSKLAVGDFTGDGRPDAIVSNGSSGTLTLFENTGPTFLPATLQQHLGSAAAIAGHDLQWNGSLTVTSATDLTGALAVGDWIGLPRPDPAGGLGGDPLADRYFKVTAIAFGAPSTVTIADPQSYGVGGPGGVSLLPGAALLGGATGGTGRTRRIASSSFPDAFLPDSSPGAVVIMPVDGDALADVVVVNRPSQPVQSTLASPASTGSLVIRLAGGGPPPNIPVGVGVSVGPDIRRVDAWNPGTRQITLDAVPSANHAAGTPVRTLDSGAWYLTTGSPIVADPFAVANRGHLANHSFSVRLQGTGGTLGAPTMTTLAGGLFPENALAADVAGPGGAAPDGLLDLIVVCAQSPRDQNRGCVAVFVRLPGGGFQQPTAAAGPTRTIFDTGTAALQTFTTPGGTMGPTDLRATSEEASVADVTSNGFPDIAVLNAGEASVTFIANGPPFGGAAGGQLAIYGGPSLTEGTRTFTLPTPATLLPTGVRGLDLGDLDGDGNVDMIVTDAISLQAVCLRGAPVAGGGLLPSAGFGVSQSPAPPSTTGPSFTPTVQNDPAQPYAYLAHRSTDCRIRDVDGDGRGDLVVVAEGANVAQVFRSRPAASGSLSLEVVSLTPGQQPAQLELIDLDGDARLDLLVLDRLTNDVARFHAVTRGTLDAYRAFPVGAAPLGAVVADLTPTWPGNEVAVTNNANNSISVLRQDSGLGLTPIAPFAPQLDIPTETQLRPSVTPAPTAPGNVFTTILPKGIDAGDLDGDGRPDLAVACEIFQPSSPQLCATDILRNAGGAAPLTTTSVVLQGSGEREASDVVIGQLVGSAAPDVAFTCRILSNNNSRGAVVVFPGDGAGGFGARMQLSAPTLVQPRGLARADLDGDGDLDLVVATQFVDPGGNTNVSLIVQNPPGTLAAPTLAVPGGVPETTAGLATAVAVGDLNNDGAPDIVHLGTNASKVTVLFQTTPVTVNAPTFGNATSLTALLQPVGAAIGDVDGDGLADLCVAFAASNQVAVYLQRPGVAKTPANALRGPIFLESGPSPFGVALGDLDGDGRNDLVVTSRGSSSLNVYFQR